MSCEPQLNGEPVALARTPSMSVRTRSADAPDASIPSGPTHNMGTPILSYLVSTNATYHYLSRGSSWVMHRSIGNLGGMGSSETVLVRVTGPDRPGITAGLMSVLSVAGADIQDVEQISIRGHLNLGVVVSVPAGRDLLKELLVFGWEQDVTIGFEPVQRDHPERHPSLVVTVLGRSIDAADFGAVAEAIASADGNIDRIFRLSKYPVISYELLVQGGDVDQMRSALVSVGNTRDIDIALQRHGLGRRAKRLVVLDMDSTLIQQEAIDLLAEEAGVMSEVTAITERAMAGELDFEQSLRERVRLLAGLDELAVRRAQDRLTVTPGARTFIRTLKRLGYKTAVVSGGFTSFVEPLAEDLGIDHTFANTLEFDQGALTGELVGDILDRAGKAVVLRHVAQYEGVAIDQTVAVGDGANDLDMLATAGLGIAFNAKQIVQDAADTSLSVPYLDAILFILGITREEVEAADVADGIDPEENPPV
jgi:phosphoserine phosphatase